MKLSFYCAMRNFKGRGLSLSGIDNESVIYIHSNDLYAAVSYTPFKTFSETPENIRKHENIINTIGAKTKVVPFSFNTIIGETIGKGILFRHYNDLKQLLKTIGGKKEYKISVNRNSTRKKKQISMISGNLRDIINSKKTREEFEYNKTYDISGKKLAGRIHNNFIEIAADSKYEHLKSEEMLFEGYYLVDEKKVDMFDQTVNWVTSLYPELYFAVRGPQPAYHFNTISITAENKKLHGKKYTS